MDENRTQECGDSSVKLVQRPNWTDLSENEESRGCVAPLLDRQFALDPRRPVVAGYLCTRRTTSTGIGGGQTLAYGGRSIELRAGVPNAMEWTARKGSALKWMEDLAVSMFLTTTTTETCSIGLQSPHWESTSQSRRRRKASAFRTRNSATTGKV